MRSTANTSEGGRFCGRAVRGVSNLSREDMHQVMAHRAKDRPTPWAHLAIRFGVNEVDLRRLFEANNDNVRDVKPEPAPPSVLTLSDRDAVFRTMWLAGISKNQIMESMRLAGPAVDLMRVRLRLEKRKEGKKPNSWTTEEDAFIRQHYVLDEEPAESVAARLGRTKNAVVGRAHRQGWTRRKLASLAA